MSFKVPEILDYLPSRIKRSSPQIPTHPPLHKIFRSQEAGSCTSTFGDLGEKNNIFGGQELDSKQLTGAQPLLHVRNLPTERSIFAFLPWLPVRESIPRQIDKKSGAPRGKGSEILKEEERTNFFSPLHSLGLYNNNVSCLRTVSGVNLLANPVILKCKLWE